MKPVFSTAMASASLLHVAGPLCMPRPVPASVIADSVDPRALDQLHELDDCGSSTFFLELVALFTESTPQLLSQASMVAGDPVQLRLLAHTLKGSCSNFGAHRMETLCLELEQLGRDGGVEGARDLIDGIEREFFNVRAALASHCAEL